MSLPRLRRFDPSRSAVTLPPGTEYLASRAAGEKAWLEARAGLECTSSAAGQKLGVSPYPPSAEGGEFSPEARRRMNVGSLLEGAVLSDEAVRKKLAEFGPFQGAELEWNEDDWLIGNERGLGATPDGVMVRDGRAVGAVEVKFVSAAWDGRSPPAYYRAQALLSASLLGADHYALAAWQQGATGVMRPYVWFGAVADGISVIGAEMDTAAILDVLAGDAPPPKPLVPFGGVATADEGLQAALAELRAARAVKKEGADREKAAKAEILERVSIRPAEIVSADGERLAEIVVSRRKA